MEKIVILCILLLLDPYALNSDRAIPFCKGLGLTMKHGPYVKLTASFLLISTAVQVTSETLSLRSGLIPVPARESLRQPECK